TYTTKTVKEMVPHTVTKKVPYKVVEKVPVTTTRTVKETQLVKVPYQVTRNVPVTEVQKVPVTVRRNAMGAYVEASSLCGEAAEPAKKGASVVCGGSGAIPPGSPTYDTDGPGRVFVEGAQVCRDVNYHVTQVKPVTEVRRIPYTVTKMVPHEVVRHVPTQV